MLARGELDEAERELLLARRLDPQYVTTPMHMVNLRLGQGHFADAQAALEAMRDIAPGNAPAWGLAAVIAMLKDDPRWAAMLGRRQPAVDA